MISTHHVPQVDQPASGLPSDTMPSRDDPAELLHRLTAEREPSLEQLLRERDPRFYTAMGEMFERQIHKLVRERDGA